MDMMSPWSMNFSANRGRDRPLATAERSTESRVSLYLVVFGSIVAALLLNLLVLPTLALGLMEVSGWLWLFALRAAGLFG